MTPNKRLSRQEIEEVECQTEMLIHGLRNLRDALGECAGKDCSKLSCAEIEENLGRATEYNSQLDDPERYEALRKGMLDFAQPLMQAAREGDTTAIRKKNIMLSMLERKVAGTFMPIRLIIALHFCLSEQSIVTLEALRTVQAELGKLHYRTYFGYDEFSPKTLLDWLLDIPTTHRGTLWENCQSALETLFLYTYRNNVRRATEACRRWLYYREPQAVDRLYDDRPRYELYGGTLYRFH